MTDRIPWPVDMRGWEKVGYYADCDIWAKGNRRRLIETGGPVVFSYEVGQRIEQKPWTEDDSRALAYHGEDD